MNHILKALILCACVLAINCGVTGQEQDNSTLTKLQSQFKSQITQNEDGPLGLINRLFKFFQATEQQQQQKDKIEQPVEQGNSTVKRNKRQAYGGGYGGPQGGYGGPQGGYGGPQGGYGGPQGGYGGPQGGYGGPQGGYGGGGYGGYDDGPAPDFFYSDEFLYDYYDWVCSETNCQLCNILTAECCDPEVNVNCFLPDSCLNNPCLSGGTCITSRTIDNAFPDFICACLPGFTGKYCQLTNEYLLPPSALLGLGGPQGGYGGPQGGYGGPQGGYGQQAPQPNYGRAPQGYGGPAPYGGQQGGPAPYGGQQSGPAPYGGQQSGPAPYGAPQRGPAPGPYGGQQGGPVAPGPYGGQQGGPGPYGGQQGGPVAPGPYGGQQGPQRSGPVAPGPVGPAPYGSQGAVRTLSAKSTTWPGFDCNCQGKGYCAQVGTEENSEPEFFCICDNGTYGSRCDEGFKNPCADKTMLAKFAPIDRQIPGYYFIECKTMMPYVRKCENGKRFNPKTNMCQTVKQKPIPRPVQ